MRVQPCSSSTTSVTRFFAFDRRLHGTPDVARLKPSNDVPLSSTRLRLLRALLADVARSSLTSASQLRGQLPCGAASVGRERGLGTHVARTVVVIVSSQERRRVFRVSLLIVIRVPSSPANGTWSSTWSAPQTRMTK